MDLQHLLQRLETIIMEGKRVPGTQLRVVDAQRCFQLIDQMVIAIPEEIRKAQQTEQERDRIIAQSREEAERIRILAQEDASRMADQTSIIAVAQQRAMQIEERARHETDRMRADADTYAIDTLRRLGEELEKLTNVANNGITKLEDARAAKLERLNGAAQG
jgi:hypothetical protein